MQFDVEFVSRSKTTYINMLTVRPTLIDDIVRASSIVPFSYKIIYNLIVDNLDDCPIEWFVREGGCL